MTTELLTALAVALANNNLQQRKRLLIRDNCRSAIKGLPCFIPANIAPCSIMCRVYERSHTCWALPTDGCEGTLV